MGSRNRRAAGARNSRTTSDEGKNKLASMGFLPLCPDFVVELLSPSDSRPAVERKMEEYRENGARLGWLLDPDHRSVTIYRAGGGAERRQRPDSVTGEEVLPGFVLSLSAIWKIRVLRTACASPVHEDHKAPIFAVNVWHNVGAADKAPGKTVYARACRSSVSIHRSKSGHVEYGTQER